MLKIGFYDVVCDRYEIVEFPLTANDEAKVGVLTRPMGKTTR